MATQSLGRIKICGSIGDARSRTPEPRAAVVRRSAARPPQLVTHRAARPLRVIRVDIVVSALSAATTPDIATSNRDPCARRLPAPDLQMKGTAALLAASWNLSAASRQALAWAAAMSLNVACCCSICLPALSK
jgi:hypothetical protein